MDKFKKIGVHSIKYSIFILTVHIQKAKLQVGIWGMAVIR